MSLLTLTASATQTATTNVTIKPKTITFFLSLIFKSLSCFCLLTVQRYGCLRTQANFLGEKDEK